MCVLVFLIRALVYANSVFPADLKRHGEPNGKRGGNESDDSDRPKKKSAPAAKKNGTAPAKGKTSGKR